MNVLFHLPLLFGLFLLNSSCGGELLLSESARKNSGSAKLGRLTPDVAQPGTVVLVLGNGISRDLTARIGGLDLDLDVISKRGAKFILPSNLGDGLVKVDFQWPDGTVESLNLVQGHPTLKLGFSDLPPSSVCKGNVYKSKAGLVLEGEQNCDTDYQAGGQSSCTEDGETNCLATSAFPAVDKEGELESNSALIHESLQLAGSSGTMGLCSGNDSACYIPPYSLLTQALKAENANAFVPSLIKAGTVLAGVTGTFAPRPADCAADSATACVAVTNYPAANKAAIDASAFDSSMQVAGVTGSIQNCNVNGSACYLPAYGGGQVLKAIDFTPITTDVIKQGSSLAGVNGTLMTNPPNCGTDGQLACVAVAAFPATVKAALTASKIHDSLTLGGVTGTQSDCAADAAVGCFAVNNYPAVQKSLITASSFHQSLTLGGIQGTLSDCAANGSNCYLASYAPGTQPLRAIDFDGINAGMIKQGSTVAGISGTVVERPANCSADGATSCVTTAAFPSLDKGGFTTGQAKISSSLSLAGVTGSLNDCSGDGQLSCKTVANFPSMSTAAATANKIHSSLNLAAVSGSLNDCSSDGQSSCSTVSTYPAVDKQAVDANKAMIRSSLTIAGISGTMGACAANGSDCYLAAYAAGTQPRKAIDYDGITAAIIKTGASVAGVNGSLVERPADCNADAQTSCVAVANYPAMDKVTVNANTSRLHSSLTAAGVSGTLADCSADGVAGCYAVSNFPATDQGAIDTNKSKIRSTLTLGGVTGTMNACAANGSDCFLAAYSLVTQPLKAIDFSSISANVIKKDIVIAAVTGTVVESSPDCSSDGQTSCVATSSYPAMDKVNVDANKAKMHSSISAAGVSGTLGDCSSDGMSSCLAVSNFPAVDVSVMNAQKAKVSSNLQIGAVAGTMATCSALASNCMLPTYVATTQPLKAIDFDSISAPIIKVGATIAGIAGSLAEKPADCDSDGEINCVAVANYPAMDYNNINSNKAKMLSSLSAGGVTGTLGNCASDDEAGCYAVSAYPAFDKTAASNNVAKIRSSLTFAGITGTLGDCAANGSTCYLPAFSGAQRFKAIDFDSILPGLVKKNTVIAGVTGDYPSSNYPLSVGDGHNDLVSTTFNSQMTDASNFGWFNRDGTRLSAAGDADIDEDNIKSGISIFGVNGALAEALDPWDVRAGTSYGSSSTGKLKASCRDLTDLSVWDFGRPQAASVTASTDVITATAHGLSNGQRVAVGYTPAKNFGASDVTNYYVINQTPNTFQISTTSGGSAVDLTSDQTGVTIIPSLDGVNSIYDTVDPISGGSSGQPSGNPWGSADYACLGLETVAGDSNVWRDVTSGTCNDASDDCIYLDKITKLEWSEVIGTGTYAVAIAGCSESTFAGKSDWRLPTQTETMEAAAHGIYGVANANWIQQSHIYGDWFWSSSKSSSSSTNAWRVSLGSGDTGNTAFLSSAYRYVCVRND